MPSRLIAQQMPPAQCVFSWLLLLLVSYSTLAHRFFSGMLCVVYDDTRRSSNWPIAVVTRNRGLGYSHMTPLAFFSIFGAVLAAADPTLRPSTPPTQRPTTSSTPQPTDLIRILEQDVQSAPFDLPSNTCAAFQVSFEGGSDKKFRVQITDSEKGLNYVAAGLAYYNKNEVFGDPFTLAKCDRNFDYDAQSPQPQCWGPDSSAVDVSGYKDRGDCSGDVDAFVKDLGDDVVATFAFRASNTNNCRTSSGDYYLYVYAQRRTSVSFLVTAAKSSCGGNSKAEKYP